jgi:hypothetical protein
MDIKQDEILNLIRKQEAGIEKLLETKKKATDETVRIVAEVAVLQKQSFIEELRGIM